jgi:hypothetical protein
LRNYFYFLLVWRFYKIEKKISAFSDDQLSNFGNIFFSFINIFHSKHKYFNYIKYSKYLSKFWRFLISWVGLVQWNYMLLTSNISIYTIYLWKFLYSQILIFTNTIDLDNYLIICILHILNLFECHSSRQKSFYFQKYHSWRKYNFTNKLFFIFLIYKRINSFLISTYYNSVRIILFDL